MPHHHELIVIRGGGDLATGVAQKLYRSGFPIVILEVEKPTAIRRTVALSEAIYDSNVSVEDMTCRHIHHIKDIASCHKDGIIPMMIDPMCHSIDQLAPSAVIDVILAKRNLGMHRAMAPITIALGPGFQAGVDVDAVIETMRGHDLGRLILQGRAQANTGIPGEIGGKSSQRVIHAPVAGQIVHHSCIGDIVDEGTLLFSLDNHPVRAPFRGLLRGLIRENSLVHQGMKVADIDPRCDVNWKTISDKARCLGGSVLEAYLYLKRRNH
ncbi:selenium-dependent molybdenum cofactor biosynthesis protein YqeB (plasmid) [Entomospira entomophila]|uniref:EF2563 family selenium-dependent molybdenum hydroxylase system protein n=1 Tax=Entomospira entomophila TaxID=2719988 RepID=A0A968GA45_9SPIO|nr:selenium-dependent molybdenum cofactor biosynthesis protein YqeB [Entomospira entomophilus]NIZ41322.1 EF2563 family selenium-dependent molybdenum hydroxylase system protein [Entomospira entomophilus]WDI36266.1 selenium-dependent molybdenum cofactor biosynthesis protein YqeB [Entomospira entomophilus]